MSPADALQQARLAVWGAQLAAQDVPDAALRQALDAQATALWAVLAALEATQREGVPHAAA